MLGLETLRVSRLYSVDPRLQRSGPYSSHGRGLLDPTTCACLQNNSFKRMPTPGVPWEPVSCRSPVPSQPCPPRPHLSLQFCISHCLVFLYSFTIYGYVSKQQFYWLTHLELRKIILFIFLGMCLFPKCNQSPCAGLVIYCHGCIGLHRITRWQTFLKTRWYCRLGGHPASVTATQL